MATVDFIAPGSLTTAELEVPEPGSYPAVLTMPQSPDEIARFELTISEQ